MNWFNEFVIIGYAVMLGFFIYAEFIVAAIVASLFLIGYLLIRKRENEL